MQGKLVEFYLSKKEVEGVDISLLLNVNCDNVIGTLNSIYNFDWCYEIEDIKEISNEVCIVLVLYTPGRIFSKVTSSRIINDTVINTALVNALRDMYTDVSLCKETMKENVAENVKNKEIETTTLDELEKEMMTEKEEKENKETEISTSPKNQFGIRQDQINFMNEFKEKYHIDSDDKFNYYIRTWSDNTGREITSKKELVVSGEKAVDEFIKWASTIAIDKTSSILEIVSPI